MVRNVITLAAIAILSIGCVSTEVPGVLNRNSLFGNIEFDELYMNKTTQYTNGVIFIEQWRATGVKSDHQKALETINKAIDAIPQKP